MPAHRDPVEPDDAASAAGEARLELEHARQELDAFLSRVSHDLRSSVLSIVGFCDLVLEELPTEVDVTVRQHIERISANAEHLQRQVLDLSELARVRRQPPPDQLVDLAEVAAAVALDLRHRHPLARMEVGELPAVALPAGQCTQLVSHLVGNAIEHSGRPDVSVVVSGERDDERGVFVVVVADDGDGIPAHERHRVLEPFYRLGGRPAGEGGTGIGLTLCQRIAEAADGHIEVGASDAGGAAVRVALPLERVRERSRAS